MAVVYKSFEDGTITVTEIRCFVGIYVGYVLVVLGSDLYHKYVYVPRKRRQHHKMYGADGGHDDADEEENAEKSIEVILGEGSIKDEPAETEKSSLLGKPKALQARGRLRGYSETVNTSGKRLLVKADADA